MQSIAKMHIPEAERQTGDPYENLANAIVITAARDYLTVDEYHRKSIAHFFRSQYFTELTEIDPEWLISVLDTEIRQKTKPRGRRRK